MNGLKNQRPNLLCLIAPTASGKTFFAHQLYDLAASQGVMIDLISLDSALIYQDMNIGTAKPSATELKHYPYHLVNICQVTEHYDVAHFLRDAKKAIDNSYQQGRTPIVVGGTMMYYKALSEGLNDLPSQNPAVREMLDEQAKILGWHALYEELVKIDPIAAEKIKSNDRQRIQRALEIYHITQKTSSEFFAEQTKQSSYNCQTYILEIERPTLHQLIEKRFTAMLKNGLIEEVQNLLQKYPSLDLDGSAMRAVGYRQTLAFLEHQNIQRLYDEGTAATRQLAKRQITWLRKLALAPNTAVLNYQVDDAKSMNNVLERLMQGLQNNNIKT